MIFARYKGENDGEFSAGKTYVAEPEMNGEEMVGFGFLDILTDLGTTRRILPDEGLFDFMNSTYAVVIATGVDGCSIGDVVEVDDATKDGKLSVKALGFHLRSKFVLLDRTSVYPGVAVMDRLNGKWVRIRRVDEALWFVVEDSDAFRSPEEFRFAVAGVDLLVEPIAKCLSEVGLFSLTEGRLYRVLRCDAGMWTVIDNDGKELICDENRFRMGS